MGVTHDGVDFWFYDLSFQWIAQTNEQGSLGFTFFPGDKTIRDLTWDGRSLWAVNTAGVLRQYTRSGTELETISGLLPGGWGLTFDGSHLWVSDPVADKIYQVSLEDVVAGDVNGDGVLGREDVVDILEHVLHLQLLEGSAFNQADCNGDGRITVIDALGIVNLILKLGGCGSLAEAPRVSPEVLEYVQSLESFFSHSDFNRCLMLLGADARTPTEYELMQNYPNPFNAETAISYQLSAVGEQSTDHSLLVTLKIFNILGQEVRTLVEFDQQPGYHSITWDGFDGSGREVPSGIYFYQLQAGEFTATRRMMVMK